MEQYYNSLETRLGNWLFFGGRAHLGYYPQEGVSWWKTWCPFPIRDALVAMEDHIFDSLRPKPGARVLDAGCGDGQVAIHLANRGLRIHAIDVLPQKVMEAKRNVEKALIKTHATGKHKSDTDKSALDALTVQQGDYHHLDAVDDSSLDGVYTIETLAHAVDLGRVLGEFYRVLKRGGTVALYEYDHWSESSPSDDMDKVHRYGGISSTAAGTAAEDQKLDMQFQGLAKVLVKMGFEEVQEIDLTDNVRPLLRLFVLVLFIPYVIVSILGLEAYCVNTIAVVVNYRRRWKYVAVTAWKPTA